MFDRIAELTNENILISGKEIKEVIELTKNEIKKEIEVLEKERFMNAMNDHWSASDYAFDDKCREEIKRLKSLLNKEE